MLAVYCTLSIFVQAIKMCLLREYYLCTIVLLTLLVGVDSSKSLQSSGGVRNIEDAVEKYFPHENSLCVVLVEPDTEDVLPQFHVPVVIYNQDGVLQNCGGTIDQDGYVFITSNSTSLEKQIVPLLKCFNRTTFKLKTKYLLVLDSSKNATLNNYDEIYSNFFHSLWEAFGIINIAVLPIQKLNLDTDQSQILYYNPFLPTHNSSPSAIIRTSAQNIRNTMIDRFRNMHGHRLRVFFFGIPNSFVTLKDLSNKQTLGTDPGVLFKQMLEEKLNVSFDAYEFTNEIFGSKNESGNGVVEEIISGKAELSINVFFLQPGKLDLKQIQIISTGYGTSLVFVVPRPRQIESWRLFQYIFQWPVCVGLGTVLVLLSGAALLFVHVHHKTNISRHNYSGISQVVSVWKALVSVPVSRLPTSHSLRFLVALSLVFGLIFVTLFSVQLFSLIKSKPRSASITTLQDLHDSNLEIYPIWNTLSPYLDRFENTTLYKLKNNLKDSKYENANFLDPSFLNTTDRALVYTDFMTNLLATLPQSKALFQHSSEVVKEPIFQSLLVMYSSIGSVFSEHFAKWNLRLISGGFYLKWYDAFKHRNAVQYAVSSSSTSKASMGSHQTDRDPVPLSYDDLKMAFYILYIGLTVSTLCFLIEVYSC